MVNPTSAQNPFLTEDSWCQDLPDSEEKAPKGLVGRIRSACSFANLWGSKEDESEGELVVELEDLSPQRSWKLSDPLFNEDYLKDLGPVRIAPLAEWGPPPISREELSEVLDSLEDDLEPPHLYKRAGVQREFDRLTSQSIGLTSKWDLGCLKELLRYRGGITRLDLRRHRLLNREQLTHFFPKLPELSCVTLSTFPEARPPGSIENKAKDLYALLGLRGSTAHINTLKTGDVSLIALLRFLKAHPEIQRIEIMNCLELNDTMLKAFSETLTSLNWLRLVNCPGVSAEGLATVLQNQRLRVLHLEEMPHLENADLIRAAKCSRWLNGLILKGVKALSPQVIAAFLRNNRMLRVLDLRGSTGLENAVMGQLGKLGRDLEVLGLTLFEGKLSGSGLYDFLRHNEALKHLFVGMDNGNAGIFKQPRRVQIMSTHPLLTSLHLDSVYHMDETELLEILSKSRQLRLLALSTCGRWWDCDDEGRLKYLKGESIRKDDFPSVAIHADIRKEVFSTVVEAELAHSMKRWEKTFQLSSKSGSQNLS